MKSYTTHCHARYWDTPEGTWVCLHDHRPCSHSGDEPQFARRCSRWIKGLRPCPDCMATGHPARQLYSLEQPRWLAPHPARLSCPHCGYQADICNYAWDLSAGLDDAADLATVRYVTPGRSRRVAARPPRQTHPAPGW